MKVAGLVAAVFVLILSQGVSAKSVRRPLDSKSVDLVIYKKRLLSKTIEKIVLKCADESLKLKDCRKYRPVYVEIKRKSKKILEETSWGKFPKQELNTYLYSLLESYDDRFDPGPLVVAMGTGAILGYGAAGETGAIIGGVLGLPLDIIKLPFALPYALSLKIKRRVQIKQLRKRFSRLQRNKKFKTTRMDSIENFRNLLNKTIEFSKRRLY